MIETIIKLSFIFLWASAFVAAKLGLNDAGPFSMLAIRFIIVSFIFSVILLILKGKWPPKNQLLHLGLVGMFLHGFYLGGVFFAITRGTSAGISSLIVSVHPILTCLLAIIFLKEKISIDKWLGILLGMIGVIIVISPRIGGEITLLGFLSCCIAVIGISIGTIIQKIFLSEMDILGGNTIQAIFASIFFIILLLTIEPFKFNLTKELVISMSWLIFLVSIGAISMLMFLIRIGKMSSTASLFFLVPFVSAILGYFIFDEKLGSFGVIGFIITCTGVWLVVRERKNKPLSH